MKRFEEQAMEHLKYYHENYIWKNHPNEIFHSFEGWYKFVLDNWNDKIQKSELVKEFIAILTEEAKKTLSKTRLLKIYLNLYIIMVIQESGYNNLPDDMKTARSEGEWKDKNKTFVEAPIFLIWFFQTMKGDDDLLYYDSFLDNPLDKKLKNIWLNSAAYVAFSCACEKYVWAMIGLRTEEYDTKACDFERLVKIALEAGDDLILNDFRYNFPLIPEYKYYARSPLQYFHEKARPQIPEEVIELEAKVIKKHKSKFPPYEEVIIELPYKKITLNQEDKELIYKQLYCDSADLFEEEPRGENIALRQHREVLKNYETQLSNPDLSREEKKKIEKEKFTTELEWHRYNKIAEEIIYDTNQQWFKWWKECVGLEKRELSHTKLWEENYAMLGYMATDLARIVGGNIKALPYILPHAHYYDYQMYKNWFYMSFCEPQRENYPDLYYHHRTEVLGLKKSVEQAPKQIILGFAQFFRETTKDYLQLVEKRSVLGDSLISTRSCVAMESDFINLAFFRTTWDLRKSQMNLDIGVHQEVIEHKSPFSQSIPQIELPSFSQSIPQIEHAPSTLALISVPSQQLVQAKKELTHILGRREELRKLFYLPRKEENILLFDKEIPLLDLEENPTSNIEEVTNEKENEIALEKEEETSDVPKTEEQLPQVMEAAPPSPEVTIPSETEEALNETDTAQTSSVLSFINNVRSGVGLLQRVNKIWQGSQVPQTPSLVEEDAPNVTDTTQPQPPRVLSLVEIMQNASRESEYNADFIAQLTTQRLQQNISNLNAARNPTYLSWSRRWGNAKGPSPQR